MGCAKSEAPAAPEPDSRPRTPEARNELYEQARSGTLLIAQSQTTLAEAESQASKLPSRLGETRADILATLSSIRQDLAEFAMPVPPQKNFSKVAAAWRRQMVKAISAATIAIQDLDELRTLLVDLQSDRANRKAADALSLVDGLVEETVNSLIDAIQAYGGRLQEGLRPEQ